MSTETIGLLAVLALTAAPYCIGYFFTRGMMAARMKGPPFVHAMIVKHEKDAEAR